MLSLETHSQLLSSHQSKSLESIHKYPWVQYVSEANFSVPHSHCNRVITEWQDVHIRKIDKNVKWSTAKKILHKVKSTAVTNDSKSHTQVIMTI